MEDLRCKVEALAQVDAALMESVQLRAMGQMASGIAHDFNNILTCILGHVQLLQSRFARGSVQPATVQETLGLLEAAALDGAEIVRKLREFTRPAGEEACVSMALDKVIEQVLETTKPRWKDQAEAGGRRFRIVTELASVPPILGNASELRAVVINLLFNALDAMPQGGTVTIALRHIQGATDAGQLPEGLIVNGEWGEKRYRSERGGVVLLTMTDTGVGIPDSVKARIFDPFFTTKGTRGTGLGLSMVQGIIGRHHGEILVAGEEGRGTTITISLPITAEIPTVVTSEVTALPSVPRCVRILVIDDDSLGVEILIAFLQTLGHEAVVATGGPEGLRLLERNKFDLLLTDLGMPEMSGWDVAQAAKKHLPNLPVMLVTGWGDHIDPSRLAGTGVDWVLAKPYTLSDLRAGLMQVWGANHGAAQNGASRRPAGSQVESSDRQLVGSGN